MQMERNSATGRLSSGRLSTTRDPYSAADASLTQSHSFPSPGRPGSLRRPNMQDLSAFGSVAGSGAAAGAAAQVQAQAQAPLYYDLQQQQQHQQQPGNHPAYTRSNFYYNPQMQYNLPGLQPTDPQYPGQQQPYANLYQQPNLPYYRQDSAFNPYPPPLYGVRDRDNPYWHSLEGGDSSYTSSVSHLPQHSSSHGNAESYRFIHRINNNDVLCGRGGATNSHIGNRSFRLLVKEYKDKYLKAKKKEKPNVAGEIVDKIRGLDPPGRFLKKDRETGYWLDIGDVRAKEKTSQALREGAPLIRKKLKEGAAAGATTTDDEGGALSENASPEKSVADTTAQQEINKEDDGKRKVISPVQQLRDKVKSEDQDVDSSSTPSPKRKKGSVDEETFPETKPTTKNDDDNASNIFASGPPDSKKNDNDSENPGSLDSKQQVGGGSDGDDSLASLTSSKRKMTKVNEKDLTQDERDLYFNVFDPPRALKQSSSDECVKQEETSGEEKEDKEEQPKSASI
jgi:hypothetical protein